MAFLAIDREVHGLTPGRIRGPSLEHPFNGVRSVDVDLTTLLGRCRAYEPRLQDGQVFSHATAAGLWGMPLPWGVGDDIHVSAVGTQGRPRTPGATGHRIRADTALAVVHGFPVVSVAAAWCQLAGLVHPSDLVAAGDYLVSGERLPGGSRTTPACSLEQLARMAERYRGSRGARSITMALPRIRTFVDSPMETLTRLVIVGAGFPEPETGAAILVDGGRLTLHPDLYWRDCRSALEYEGDGHLDPVQFRRDILRRELFEAAGHHVIRVTSHDLFVDRAGFFRRLRESRRTRGA